MISSNVKMRRRIKIDIKEKVFDILAMIFIIIIGAMCVIPFIFIVSGSLSSESAIAIHGYSLLPQEFTLNSYKTVLHMGNSISRAYLVTTFITVVGTGLGLLLTSMSGFVLSRPDFKHRNKAAFFIYFTTLFGGGMIPSYLVNVNILHLNNNIWVLILPGILSPFNIFLFRNFVKGIPDSLVESARIDGAGDFTIYKSVIMPLTKPALATIGLFMALGYWNEWFRCNLYIKDESLYTLQYLLYSMLANMEAMLKDQSLFNGGAQQVPTETMKLATAVLATGPVLLFYPFVQKYFVGGLVIGGVKG
jgi:putative aldouronate transport system permease protein